MLDFIPIWIWGVLLIAGVVGLVWKNQVSAILGNLGKPLGLKQTTTLMIIAGLAIFAGGFGVVTSWVGGLSSATISSGDDISPNTVGGLTLKVHDGISNSTTTEDTIDDTDQFMTIYSTDAAIEDGQEYKFNITIERESIAEDSNIKVECVADDVEISGVTADNLIEKTSGEIDLDFIGATSSGNHADDNTVWTYVAFSEGTGSKNIQVKADQEETWHDGATDLQDYSDIVCTVSGDGSSDSVTVRIYPDS